MPTSFLKIINAAAQKLDNIPDNSIDLVMTSPPYPMVEMWDTCFSEQSKMVKRALTEQAWEKAFEEMHSVLDRVWKECDRVLKEHGFVCINIGDATRTVNNQFRMFSNHSRIIRLFQSMGYNVLPDILWRKPSNSPTKFMGSGMFPAGAYVTYEHEYILVFRKGGKRIFQGEERLKRRESAYFWEERNLWFSDLWEINGTVQKLEGIESRNRNASYPLEIPYRIINMYSIYGDTVLDPFGGLGTTAVACGAAMRNCIVVEINQELCEIANKIISEGIGISQKLVTERWGRHKRFVEGLTEEQKEKCYQNQPHGFLVKTKQEKNLTIYTAKKICESGGIFSVEYEKFVE